MEVELAEEVDSVPTDEVITFTEFPLVESFFGNMLQAIGTSLDARSSDRLEIDLRSTCMGLLQSVIENEADLDSIESFWVQALQASCKFVDWANRTSSTTTDDKEMKQRQFASASVINHLRKVPIALLEDILDALSTVSGFNFWERVMTRSSPLFCETMWNPDPKSHPCWLPFLKAANKFLRRLRDEGEAGFAASVLQTLSCVYPVSEKSATRAWGSHNPDHLTALESELEFEDHRVAPLTKSANKEDHLKPVPSYSFYRTLWTLQHDFRNPNGIAVVEFLRRLTSVLRSFQSHQCVPNTVQIVDEQHLSPYSTKSRLLPIQLGDPATRTTMLIQFWIVSHHLISQVPSMKKQLEPHIKTTETLLPAAQLDHLRNSPIFQHSEKQWTEWKRDKCQNDLDERKLASPPPKKRKRLSTEANASEIKSVSLEETSKKMRTSEPLKKSFMEDYVDACDPESGIEEQYHPKLDAVFSWRAERLFARDNLEQLVNVQPDGDLEIMVRKFYESEYQIEIPGTPPTPYSCALEDDEPSAMEVDGQDNDIHTNGNATNKDVEALEPKENHTETSDGAEMDKTHVGELDNKSPISETAEEKKISQATEPMVLEEEPLPIEPSDPNGGEKAETEMKERPPSAIEPIRNSSSVSEIQGEASAKPVFTETGKAKPRSFREPPTKENGHRRSGDKDEAQHRRGNIQFQPRQAERRDSRPRAEDRIPDDRSRNHGDRGRPLDRQRNDDRIRHRDDRSRDRPRHDERRGGEHPRRDDRRGDNRGWRPGDRRR